MSDDDSDDWATEELDLSKPVEKPADEDDDYENDKDEEDWDMAPLPAATPKKETDDTKCARKEGSMMILVDLTHLNPDIHSRFDKQGVSDAQAASVLRKSLDYATYSKHMELIAEGTVIPCGSSVWKEALSRLRDERPGHYVCPIFP